MTNRHIDSSYRYPYGIRPIKPTSDAEVKVDLWNDPTSLSSQYNVDNPWKVLTRYPNEAGWTLVGSFGTEDEAWAWAGREKA